MQYKPGQIVCYYPGEWSSTHNTPSSRWKFIIVEALPRKNESSTQYYKCFCIKAPENQSSGSDLHKLLHMSSEVINAV